MEKENKQMQAVLDLNDEDKNRILESFHEEIIPKLRKLHARLGTLSCEFAGEQYGNWVIHFKSAGSDFAIDGFEYDEDAAGIDLDL